MAKGGTKTSGFGVSRRESHDASAFYGGAMVQDYLATRIGVAEALPFCEDVPWQPLDGWADRCYCHTAERMAEIPNDAVALAVTSPPFNVGKDYGDAVTEAGDDLSLADYLTLFDNVAGEVYRTLVPGGKFVVNVTTLGRKPAIFMDEECGLILRRRGFLPFAKLVWQKGEGAGGNCAWGSWQSASSPSFRDIHEYLLVYGKDSGIVEQGVWKPFKRGERGVSTMTKEEFMAATLSVWKIAPESAKRLGVPAPFPVALPETAIKLLTYQDDVVLDPFMGSGSTAVAAVRQGRHWVGYDIVADYCTMTQERAALAQAGQADKPRKPGA